jgi:hypothetical protein
MFQNACTELLELGHSLLTASRHLECASLREEKLDIEAELQEIHRRISRHRHECELCERRRQSRAMEWPHLVFHEAPERSTKVERQQWPTLSRLIAIPHLWMVGAYLFILLVCRPLFPLVTACI